jgi:hypothetical protein
MADSTELTSLPLARDRAIARLNEAFANDHLALDEFESRLTVAHHADTIATIEQLTRDLPAATTPIREVALVPTIASSLVPASKTMIAIMSGVQRKGVWTPARVSRVAAIMGGAELDFREAQLGPGVTELQIFACMGGVHIIVPPTLAVDMDGSALLGGFDQTDRAPVTPDPSRPLLRITGFAFMGGVHVETRLPGETAADMRRRNRAARRELKRAQKRRAIDKPAGE